MQMPLELSWPPSINHYWRHVPFKTRTGKTIVKALISAPGRAYKRQIAAEIAQRSCEGKKRMTGQFSGRLRIDVVLCAPDRRNYDIDNRLKPLLDALVEARVMRDDEQVDLLTVRRGPVVQGGMVKVWIQELQNQGSLLDD